MALKFIALSGTIGVTENLYLYEYANDAVVIDCGVGFPEAEMCGVDLIIPDFAYLKKIEAKLRAILITHGHEDHIGALPFLLRDIQVPVYATRLTAGFIEDKLKDYGLKGVKINVIDPSKDTLELGGFRVSAFRISHSIPDACGFCLETSEGCFMHVADYKFDWTPVDGRPFDIGRAAILAQKGVTAVASDCLGATTHGYTQSEREIEAKIERIARKARGQIFFTTISSNISRIQQALNVAERLNKKVVFIGRSIIRKSQIARELGYLHYPENLEISLKDAQKQSLSNILYVISGSYGQPGSALYRVSLGEHESLSVGHGDTVIFSSDPAPPGSKVNVDSVVDRLIEIGVDVHYYELQEDLHVSGHGSREDIKMLLAIFNPQYFIPIGGTVRHMRAYRKIAEGLGARPLDVFELMPGETVEFEKGSAKKGQKIPVRQVLIDGLDIGEVGKTILRDRHVLSQDGIAIVLIQFDETKGELISQPEIISRGFVYTDKKKKIFSGISAKLADELRKKRKLDRKIIKDTTVDFLSRVFLKETGRLPMILPVVAEI